MSFTLFDKIFRPKKLSLNNGKVVLEKKSRNIVIIPIVILAIFISMRITNFSFSTLIKNGANFLDIIKRLFNPTFSYFKHVIPPLIDTIKMSFLGSFLGAFFGLIFAYFASSNIIKNKFINGFVKVLFSLLRTIPTLVIALIATYIFGLGTLAGTIAIFLYSFSYVGKLTNEQIETVNMGAYEALLSMGYTKFFAFLKGILPYVLPFYLSTALYNFEGNLRYAAILGYVGAGGLGLVLNENIAWREYENAGMVLLCLLITVFIIENVSSYFRRRLG